MQGAANLGISKYVFMSRVTFQITLLSLFKSMLENGCLCLEANLGCEI